jgi:hypothetical protein
MAAYAVMSRIVHLNTGAYYTTIKRRSGFGAVVVLHDFFDRKYFVLRVMRTARET